MKRILFISLSLLLLLAAVRPTLVFHYCAGNLRSVALGERELPHHCCGKCCSDYKITLSTDDYQPVSPESIGLISQFLQPVVFLCPDDFFPKNNFSFPYLIQHFFPPGKTAKYGFDLLREICVFRI
ncbi:MAG: hypothetical protein LBG77_03195 [Dysgonamonadaceae bacterium]|jgi:hypothetical protein|nr:hypothetical protein [Dysgonamonadaceae bacterium]